MLYWLARLEETWLSVFIRETGSVFFSALTLHSLSMAFVAGINIMLCLRVLGLARRVPLPRFSSYLPVMWAAVAIVAVSGLVLLLAYPAKGLTNAVFYLKLGVLLVALGITWGFSRRYMMPAAGEYHTLPWQTRALAVAGLLCWSLVIGAGRFLAYTHSILLASSFY